MDWSDDPMLQCAGNFIWPRIDEGIYINDTPAPPLYKVDTNPVVFGDGSSGTGGSYSSNRSSSRGKGTSDGDGSITVGDCKNPINHSSRHEKTGNADTAKERMQTEKIRDSHLMDQRIMQQIQWHKQNMKDIQEYREAAKDLNYHAGQVIQKRDLLEVERFSSQGGGPQNNSQSDCSSNFMDDNTLKIIIIVLLFAMVIIQAMTLAATKKIVNLAALTLLTENI